MAFAKKNMVKCEVQVQATAENIPAILEARRSI